MNNYIELRLDLSPCNETMTDILAAMLCDVGYESFVPDSSGLTAYVREEDYSSDAVLDVIRNFPVETAITESHRLVEGRDWNEEWEKNYFKPIVIGGECAIHSSFHTDVPRCTYDIVIDPKMAFGTGHHATTTLILRRLLDMDVSGLKVCDMGTGTAILAILASMKGAAKVDAVEIDEFAYRNAIENVELNKAGRITLHLGDATVLASIRDIDLFLANINRNVITADLPAYADTLSPGAKVILSGFYEEDIPVVLKSAEAAGLGYIDHTVMDRWTSLLLEYRPM